MDAATYRANILYLWHQGKHFEAMKLLWREKIIDCEPTRRLIKALAENRRLYVIGHGAASKTFTTVAFKLLKWYANPTESALLLTSSTRTSLASRAWADLKLLHRDCVVTMPGTILASQYKLRYDPSDDKHTILGISGDDEDSESKIRGLHARYNDLVIDEADNPYNQGIWKAVANLGISGDFCLAALTNPVDRNSIFGQRCEPEGGFDSLDIDTSKTWDSRGGVPVLRLDGLDSPNIVSGETKYPFLLTQKGIDDIISEFGQNSAVYFTQVRGWFPPTGSVHTVFDSALTHQLQSQPITFYSDSTPIAACDPSLGGGDRCIILFARAGLMASDPRKGCLIIDELINIKRRAMDLFPTIDFAKQIKELCLERKVEAKNLSIDSSSATQGIADYLAFDWSRDIDRVNFGGACSLGKILQEDSRTCEQRFDRFVTELWWTGREWTRAGQVTFPKLPRELKIQLESRRWEESRTQKAKIRLEEKSEMKKRGLKSPDEGDAFNLIVRLAKMRFGSLGATTLSGFDPEVISKAVIGQKAPSNRHLFEPSYKTDPILRTDENDEMNSELLEKKYGWNSNGE